VRVCEKNSAEFVSQIHNLQGTRKRFLNTLFQFYMLKKAKIFLQHSSNPPLSREEKKVLKFMA